MSNKIQVLRLNFFYTTDEKYKIYYFVNTKLATQQYFVFQLLLFLALTCAVLTSGKSTGKRQYKHGKFYVTNP